MKKIVCLLLMSFQLTLFSQSLDIPLITTTGTAEVHIPVDEVHFSVSTSHTAELISDARNNNTEVTNQVINLLKNKGVSSKYIQTKSMNVDRNYLRNTNYTKWDGFIASQNIYVCLTDPSKYDEILDQLLTMDIARLKGANFKSTKRKEAMEKARAEAILISKKKAIQLAEALGQSVGAAKLIIENRASQGSTETYSTGTALVTDAESTNQSFAAGQLRIQASVTVSYVLNE